MFFSLFDGLYAKYSYHFLPFSSKKALLLFSQIPVFSLFPFYFLSSCHISKRTPFGGFAMSRKNIITGTLILTCANLITKCMGFFYRVFMSNAIGAEGMGLYQLILPLYMLAWSITSAGRAPPTVIA